MASRKRIVPEDVLVTFLENISEKVAQECIKRGAEAMLKPWCKKEGWATQANVVKLAQEGPEGFRPKKLKLGVRDRNLLEKLILLRIACRKLAVPVEMDVMDFVKQQVHALAPTLPDKRAEYEAELEELVGNKPTNGDQ